MAERHRLAAAIDRHVIARAIRLIAGRPRSPGLRWEINLSADALADLAVPDVIDASLAETGVPPESIVFEITKTAAIANMDQARTFAAHVTTVDCRFVLDDSGAGYGSFYCLKHLPFYYLKIG